MYNAVYIATVTPSPISHVITTPYIEHNSNAHILVGLISLCIIIELYFCTCQIVKSMKVMIGFSVTWYKCYNYSGVFVSFMYELLANLLAESCEREKDRASQTENVTSSIKTNHNTFDVLIWTDNLPWLSSFLNSSLQNQTINTLQMYIHTRNWSII